MDLLLARANELGTRMNGNPEQADECVAQLSEMLGHVTDPSTVAAIVENLGHGWTDAACRAVLPLAEHAAVDVRLAVARALHQAEDRDLERQVLDAVIRLSADESDEVRNWATFKLGSQFDVDSSDLRDALAVRLDDAYDEVRAEAMVGLARRHDPRATDAVRAALSNVHTGALTFEAARLLADPGLHSLLVKWSNGQPDDDEIAAATEACDSVRQQSRRQQQGDLLLAVQQQFDQQATGRTATMFCSRFDDEVLLTIGDGTVVWHVTALLDRAGDHVPTAARMVTDQAQASADE